MSSFKFLHAADLHLDSPLLGLSVNSADFAARVEQASRQAFENLLDLAIAENVVFVADPDQDRLLAAVEFEHDPISPSQLDGSRGTDSIRKRIASA